MPAPKCPTELQLTSMMKRIAEALDFIDAPLDNEELLQIGDTLAYLDNMLANRRGYQKKQQIKRAVLKKIAHEQGWDQEIDDAVRAQHANVMEAESLDDVEDTQ